MRNNINVKVIEDTDQEQPGDIFLECNDMYYGMTAGTLIDDVQQTIKCVATGRMTPIAYRAIKKDLGKVIAVYSFNVSTHETTLCVGGIDELHSNPS